MAARTAGHPKAGARSLGRARSQGPLPGPEVWRQRKWWQLPHFQAPVASSAPARDGPLSPSSHDPGIGWIGHRLGWYYMPDSSLTRLSPWKDLAPIIWLVG
ncbi:hypothetical protein Y1Q_0004816 [Alligator mississippiensis]|uniref:Uncharacterized protein n=1 Tax=Alligator mississippiensis TaxID=8496 RepID=A0A151NRB4_ALLMI|nr:hypothetical protein Y1Q_0004816 [Alligator mississippiensis]